LGMTPGKIEVALEPKYPGTSGFGL
jgi:hypothetical protein